jgi:asparagine synthase (glutamine-hydrolysing)
MKCQFGLLHTNGKPATPDELDAVLQGFGDNPAETSGETIDGSLLMAFRGNRITWEEESETQPLDEGSYLLTWDGRLDNREEFADRLGLQRIQNVPDPVLVLKSYEAFGESVFKRLIGEFASTIWCRTTKTLLFVRSTCGARPLYYTLVNGTLFWSSDFAHLVKVSDVDLDVSEDYFLEYVLTQPNTRHTPLTKLHSVPANSLLRFEGGQMKQVDELWNATNIKSLRYRAEQQYEEHFREVLTEAVRVRLRAKPPIFAELSGGLDSSTVVLTADRILRSQSQPPESLRTLSFIYDESETADERRFIRVVEERRGFKTLLVREKDQGFTLGLESPEFTGLPNPNHCSTGRYETYADLLKENGGHVVLTGLGGDHLFWSAPEGAPLIADELRRGNLVVAHRECCAWSLAGRVPYLRLLFSKALPLAMTRPYNLLEIPAWLSHKMRIRAFRNKQDLLGNQPRHACPSRRAQLFAIDLLFRTVGCGYFNEYKKLYVSHPYTHRPLVEFCLSASLSQFLRGGQTRSLMRRALIRVLPEKICKRKGKAGADEAYVRAMQREWTRIGDLRQWQICHRGFVDPSELSASLRSMRLGFQHQSGYLMRLVSMERWLRSLEPIGLRWSALKDHTSELISLQIPVQ